jgi:tRNA-uridine 2-sulfurtransferase
MCWVEAALMYYELTAVSNSSRAMLSFVGMKPVFRGKVYMGMSGGVDSSVSAALLKERGFDVTGVFIKVWQPDWMTCTSREDRLDAMRVCVHLGIPFLTLDLEKEYKKEVVDYMIGEYRVGRTPNPDIMCNRHVKFGGFFDWAMAQGADFVATGHYAQIQKEGEAYRLVAGKDESKDQSYFLWTLTERELSKTLFPVGGMEKTETRRLAKKFGLPVAEKKDSQGLCFIGKVDIKEFLSHYIEPKKGDVLDEKGNIIGSHDGALFLTLGERHSFMVANKTADEKPYYIVSRDLEKNTVTVSHKSHDGSLSIEKREYALTSTNWISGMPEEGKAYQARIRHLGELLSCTIEEKNLKESKIVFEKPLVVASGQSVVVYKGAFCLGGGIVS